MNFFEVYFRCETFNQIFLNEHFKKLINKHLSTRSHSTWAENLLQHHYNLHLNNPKKILHPLKSLKKKKSPNNKKIEQIFQFNFFLFLYYVNTAPSYIWSEFDTIFFGPTEYTRKNPQPNKLDKTAQSQNKYHLFFRTKKK